MSRSYDISDFAAFLRKYGDSAHQGGDRTEEPLEMAAGALAPIARSNNTRLSRATDMTGRERSTAAATASIPCENPKFKRSLILVSSASSL